MSAPAWFNYETYVSNKLAQLQATEPDAGWTAESLQAAFTANGYSNDADGMYRHFVDFGNAENVSPSSYFVVSEYMANKLAQMQAAEPDAGWDMAKLEQAFKDAGLSAWDHYEQFGQAEGISPSSLFDTSAYLEAKLAQLQATEPDAGWETVDQVVKAFQENGLNPIEHYVLFGVNENLSYSPVMPEPPVTDELTTARDVLNLGAGDQIIGGVASALSAEKTLNENDLIDGGEGNDTLRVTLDANFNGFTVTDDPNTTGGMKNVENVELTNNGSIIRTFSAKGSEGVTTYTLHAGEAGTGVINLKDLSAAGITVNVDGLQKGTTDVQFASGALTGAEDSLTFGLNNVGAAAASATADPTYVGLKATSGLESVTINASGTNYANLSELDAPSVAVTGAGSLDVNAVNAKLTSFDASAATGNVSADLSAATMQTVKGGAGDDTFTVTNLAANATLEGGAGNDTLIISGSTGGTLQPTMSGFETIGIKDNSGKITLSAKNAQDFTALQLENAADTVTVANLNASAFTVNSNGMEDGKAMATTNKVTLADAVDLTVNVNAASNAGKPQSIETEVTASQATSAVINVNADAQAVGTMTLGAAQTVQLNVASSLDANGDEQTYFAGTITAGKADSLTVTANGLLGDGSTTAATLNVASATGVSLTAHQGGKATITADKAEVVDITSDKALDLTSSSFASAQQVSIAQNNEALIGGIALEGVSSLVVSGDGADAAVKLGALGTATNDYDLNITATGLAAGFAATTVQSAQAVNLDFSQMVGTVTTTDITATSINIETGKLAANTYGDMSANAVTVNGIGSLGDLTVGEITGTGEDSSVNISFDGAGAVEIAKTTGITADTVSINASGYLNAITGGTEIGNITADSITFVGSDIADNDLSGSTITATSLDFTGGIMVDKVTLTATTGATELNVTLDTGAGKDEVTITTDLLTEKVTVSGDMGGDADVLKIDNAAQSPAIALTEIDLSGLSGYTATIELEDTKSQTVKLGDGQDTLMFAKAATTGSLDTIDGFSATDDKFNLQQMASSLTDFSADTFNFVRGGTETAYKADSGTLNVDSSDMAALVYYDTVAETLYVFKGVAGSNGFTFTMANADFSVKLTGLDGDLSFANFDLANMP